MQHSRVAPVTLADDVVSLEPLSLEDADALAAASAGSRDTFGLTRVPNGVDGARAYIETALAEQARGVSVPFVTRDARTRTVVGSTRFMTIERWVWPVAYESQNRPPEHADTVEIGATWLAVSAQRTGINTHAKLVMLTHAFEVWGVRRVALKTDARNVRSRTAIERIGGHFDGVLRAHMPGYDGAVRDSAYFSIVESEWPAVKATLSVDRSRPR